MNGCGVVRSDLRPIDVFCIPFFKWFGMQFFLDGVVGPESNRVFAPCEPCSVGSL